MIRRVLWPVRPRPGLFRGDAAACLRAGRPALAVAGQEFIPAAGPVVLVLNHYHRAGFWAWWLTIGLSAIVPADIHWIITAELTSAGGLRGWTISPLSRWVLARVARQYGFTTMPPMPPRPGEATGRAQAVRAVLAYARHAPCPMVGLAPEGADSSDGSLRRPPAGAGRFLLHLAAAGLAIAPVAAYEADGALCFRFGPHFNLACGDGADTRPEAQDLWAAERVMRAVAALLPVELRGDYAG
jgi:1-acyl-sn-glycerol-3-phosphate acyltransferase